ncbi:MAG: hypothetical protein V5A43_04955 [Haloarculaceae archaeon]
MESAGTNTYAYILTGIQCEGTLLVRIDSIGDTWSVKLGQPSIQNSIIYPSAYRPGLVETRLLEVGTELEAADERGDRSGAQEALRRPREALGDTDG